MFATGRSLLPKVIGLLCFTQSIIDKKLVSVLSGFPYHIIGFYGKSYVLKKGEFDGKYDEDLW